MLALESILLHNTYIAAHKGTLMPYQQTYYNPAYSHMSDGELLGHLLSVHGRDTAARAELDYRLNCT